MLKKKKTTASGEPVLVKSVRRHWTSGGCPFSADRSGTETAQPQNEILCVLTQALLASFLFPFVTPLKPWFSMPHIA